MNNTISIEQNISSHLDALNLGINIESLRINSLIIDLLILAIIGFAVQVA